MFRVRQFVVWLLLAIAAVSVLISVIAWRRMALEERFGSFVSGDPHRGAHTFDEKGCTQCHALYGRGGSVGPSLSSPALRKTSTNDLVSSLWNHAPAMWERMESEKIPYPELEARDVADLLAFLYVTRYLDEPGDAEAGKRLFQQRGCSHCHAVRGEGPKTGPDLATVGVDTPIVWTQTMWNHAPQMQARMKALGLQWPQFQGTEMNDLLAYVRSVSTGSRRESLLLPADADRGRSIFRRKACAECHSVDGARRGVAPDLGSGSRTPTTIVQFAGAMWNHSPGMWEAMKSKGIQRPSFEAEEMADLIAYLYSIRYFEQPGSATEGRDAFTAHGCAACHGKAGEGSQIAPRLRPTGRPYNAVLFATAVWQHGPEMHAHVRQMGRAWPTLTGDDVADLMAFLNEREARP